MSRRLDAGVQAPGRGGQPSTRRLATSRGHSARTVFPRTTMVAPWSPAAFSLRVSPPRSAASPQRRCACARRRRWRSSRRPRRRRGSSSRPSARARPRAAAAAPTAAAGVALTAISERC